MGRTTFDDVEVAFDVDTELRPTGDQLLMKVIRNDKTVGGIILPKGEKSSSCVGRVMSVGSGYVSPKTGKNHALAFEVGDVVVTMEYMGHRMELRSGHYRIVREHGIWCYLKGNFDKNPMVINEVIPYNGKILVRPTDKEKTDGGLIVLQEKTMYQRCEIVAVCAGIRNMESGEIHPAEVSVGEKAIFRRYSGSQLTVKGEELRLIDQKDILFVMED